MIERYIFLKLNEANAARGPEVAAQARSVLTEVPGVVAVTAGTPADDGARSAWDVGIVVRFAKLEDVEPYRVDAKHREWVDGTLKPMVEVMKAWNFDVPAD